MLAKTNKMLRTELITKFKAALATGDTNLYLVFSYQANRSGADLSTDLTNVDLLSVKNEPNVKAIYAIKVTSADLFSLYINDGSGANIVNIGTEEYASSNSVNLLLTNKNISPSQVDYDAVVAKAEAPTFNTVTVVSNITTTGGNLAAADTITDFTYFYFTNARILMQARPANDNLVPEVQKKLPVLIKL
jgi:hypothetical protein